MTTKPGHCDSIDLMDGLLEGHGGTGITLRAFRLNTAFNHLMFAGNRGRVYDRIVALTGARPSTSADEPRPCPAPSRDMLLAVISDLRQG
jgi:hypothetical protein